MFAQEAGPFTGPQASQGLGVERRVAREYLVVHRAQRTNVATGIRFVGRAGCSGLMYVGVLRMTPSCVTCVSPDLTGSRALAKPKSITLGTGPRSVSSTRMLEGLGSRCSIFLVRVLDGVAEREKEFEPVLEGNL